MNARANSQGRDQNMGLVFWRGGLQPRVTASTVARAYVGI